MTLNQLQIGGQGSHLKIIITAWWRVCSCQHRCSRIQNSGNTGFSNWYCLLLHCFMDSHSTPTKPSHQWNFLQGWISAIFFKSHPFLRKTPASESLINCRQKIFCARSTMRFWLDRKFPTCLLAASCQTHQCKQPLHQQEPLHLPPNRTPAAWFHVHKRL